MDRRPILLALVLPLSALAQTPRPDARVVGTWTSKAKFQGLPMRFTFNAKGEYLALWGELDHQGDYTVKGDRVILRPTIVNQRSTAEFLRLMKENKDGEKPADVATMSRLSKPYALRLSPDRKTLTGLGFSVQLNPKAKPLF